VAREDAGATPRDAIFAGRSASARTRPVSAPGSRRTDRAETRRTGTMTTISAGWMAAALAAALSFGVSGGALAQAARATTPIPDDKDKIVGAIAIDYNSRSERSTSAVDVYSIQDLAVADLLIMKGDIQRVPDQRMSYSVRFDVMNPQNPSQIAHDAAILRGDMSIDSSGRYNPEDGRLRLDVIKGNQATSRFTGGIQGREVVRWWQIGKKLGGATQAAAKAYSRFVDGKVVTIQVKNPDPLRFESLGLAAGPFSFLVDAKVSGVFDYDYELGNWLTDQAGLQFTYSVGDNVVSDHVSGSIRYVEESGQFTDAKGKTHAYTSYYDYNLRFNEPPVNKDAAFFGGDTAQADTDAFFSAADQTKPGLYGRVYYADSETDCKKATNDKGETKCVGPTHSDVFYDLHGAKLTYEQVANWMKLEQLVIGPFTDE
jgi:hypothetical protein